MRNIKTFDSFINESKTELGDNLYQKFNHLIGKKFAKSDLESIIDFVELDKNIITHEAKSVKLIFDKFMDMLENQNYDIDDLNEMDRDYIKMVISDYVLSKINKEDTINFIINNVEVVYGNSNGELDEEDKKSILKEINNIL